MADEDVTQDAVADTTVNSGDDTQAGGADTVAGASAGNDTVAGGADTLAAADATEVKPDWPDDWRDKLTADEKLRKRLDRFKSPKDVLQAYTELEKRMSSGALKAALAADATPEQTAAWRKDNGIPETPEGYLEKLPNGLVIGDADKPMLESYLAKVHGKNASPEVVAESLDWYYASQEEALAARATADNEYRQAKTDVLRAEWGNEYRANINSITNFLDAAPVDENGRPLKELLFSKESRLADGTPFGSNPAVLKWLASLAQEANPAGFVQPGAGGSQADSVASEIAKIEKIMQSDRKSYDKDVKMQDRLRQLYAAEEKLKG